MPSSYPGSIDSFSTLVDGPGNTLMADHINRLSSAVIQLETKVGTGTGPFPTQHAVKAYAASHQNTVTTNVWTDVIFDGELYDTHAMHVTATTSGSAVLTAPTSGIYDVYAHAALGTNSSAANFALRFLTTAAGSSVPAVTNGDESSVNFRTLYMQHRFAASGDRVQLQAFQNLAGAGPINVGSTAINELTFGMHRV